MSDEDVCTDDEEVDEAATDEVVMADEADEDVCTYDDEEVDSEKQVDEVNDTVVDGFKLSEVTEPDTAGSAVKVVQSSTSNT